MKADKSIIAALGHLKQSTELLGKIDLTPDGDVYESFLQLHMATANLAQAVGYLTQLLNNKSWDASSN